MSCVRILLGEDNDASWSADGLPRTLDIAPTTDWIIQIVRQFLDDML